MCEYAIEYQSRQTGYPYPYDFDLIALKMSQQVDDEPT